MDRRGRVRHQQETELATLPLRRGRRRRRRRRRADSSSDESLSLVRRCERYRFLHDHVYWRTGMMRSLRNARIGMACEDSWSEDEDSSNDFDSSEADMADLSSCAEDNDVAEGARTSKMAGRRRDPRSRRGKRKLGCREIDSQRKRSRSKPSLNQASGVQSQKTCASPTGGGETAAAPAAPPPAREGVGRPQSPNELCLSIQAPTGKAASCIFAPRGQRQQRKLVTGWFTIRSSRKRPSEDGLDLGVPKKQRAPSEVGVGNRKHHGLPSGIPEKPKEILLSGTPQNPVLPIGTFEKHETTQMPKNNTQINSGEVVLFESSGSCKKLSVEKNLDASKRESQVRTKTCTVQDTTRRKIPMVVIHPGAKKFLPQHVVYEWKAKQGCHEHKAKAKCAVVDVSNIRSNDNRELHGNKRENRPSTSAKDGDNANRGIGDILTITTPREMSEQSYVGIEVLDKTQLERTADTNDMNDEEVTDIDIISLQEKSNVSVRTVGSKKSKDETRRDEATEETKTHTAEEPSKGDETDKSKHCSADNADTGIQQNKSKKPGKAKKKESGPKTTSELSRLSEHASSNQKSWPQDTLASASISVPCTLKITKDPVTVKEGSKTPLPDSVRNVVKIIDEVATGCIPIDSQRILQARWSAPVSEVITHMEKIIEKVATDSAQCPDDRKAMSTVSERVHFESEQHGSVKRNNKMVDIPKQITKAMKKVGRCNGKKAGGQDTNQDGVKSNTEIPTIASEKKNQIKAVSVNALDFLPNLARELQQRLRSPSGSSQGEFNEASDIPRGRTAPGTSKAQQRDSFPLVNRGCRQGERPRHEGNIKELSPVFTMSREVSQTEGLNTALLEKVFNNGKILSVNVQKRKKCTDIADILIRRAKIGIEQCTISRTKTTESENILIKCHKRLLSGEDLSENLSESKVTVDLPQDVHGKHHVAIGTCKRTPQGLVQFQSTGTKKDPNPTEKRNHRPSVLRPAPSTISSQKSLATVEIPPISLCSSLSNRENCGFEASDDLDDFVQGKRPGLLSARAKGKSSGNTEVSRKKKKVKMVEPFTTTQRRYENCRL
ncbi:uncharacterized protein LOC125040837 [Penaeus chinensis]|uniref:uncharacterized protein LOC125040837 n=1 Tax=Penaeus chinensis TaxID=139456 RepID=UPI001FB64C6D|nr:uncharacterized protein LOC125040837 [Penaeus chinensis]